MAGPVASRRNVFLRIRPLHVLHVIPGIAPRYGGPSAVIGPMVAALNHLPDVVAEVATTDADGPGGRIDPRVLPAEVSTHLFHRTFSERWKFSNDLWRWLRRHAADYDILHIHSLWSFASAAAARAARRAGVPYVVRPAGMLSPYTFGRGTWSKNLYWGMAERATVQGAAAFHVTSEEEAAEVRAVRPDAKTFVIPNGVDDAAWNIRVDRDRLRSQCDLNAGGRSILLFLSRIHPKKGIIDLLLPAVARMKSDAFLALAGGPDPHAPGYHDEVTAAIARLGLGERVRLLGPVAASDRWYLFDGADAFVLPSRSENFGVVVAEAMARGCPVVVTEGVHAKCHVREAGAGKVVPFDQEELAQTLDAVLADASARDIMGAQGREYVRERLDWESIARSLVECYTECLVSARNAPSKAASVTGG